MVWRRGWVGVFLFTLTLINCMDRVALSVAAPPIAKEFGLSPVAMGYLFSSFLWIYLICILPMGYLVDCFGTKRAVGVGIALWSFATIATGPAPNFGSLVASRIVMGIGESPTWPASIRVVREWSPASERGHLATICYNGINAGVAFGAMLISAVVSLLGWHAGFMVAGALGLVWLLAWQIWYGPPERVTWLSTTERTKILTERDGDLATAAIAPASRTLPFTALLRQPAVRGLVLNQGCIGYTTYLFLTWLPSYLQMAKHLSVLNAGLMTAVPYAISVVLGIALGNLSDLTTVKGGGFDVLDSERRTLRYVPCAHFPLNCVFVGDSLIVTDRGLGEDTMGIARGGRLIRFDIGVAGPKMFRGHL